MATRTLQLNAISNRQVRMASQAAISIREHQLRNIFRLISRMAAETRGIPGFAVLNQVLAVAE